MKNQFSPRQPDAVDVILEQWRQQRPDLDVSPMGPIGRIKRCAALLEQRIESGFAKFELNLWEFDMLATLLRAGAPHRLSPTELFSTLMVTSGTMTHRLKRLETRKLIERVPNEQDARSTLVQLTRKGLALINLAVEEHVENERLVLAVLPFDVVASLDASLSTLLQVLESHPDRTTSNNVS